MLTDISCIKTIMYRQTPYLLYLNIETKMELCKWIPDNSKLSCTLLSGLPKSIMIRVCFWKLHECTKNIQCSWHFPTLLNEKYECTKFVQTDFSLINPKIRKCCKNHMTWTRRHKAYFYQFQTNWIIRTSDLKCTWKHLNFCETPFNRHFAVLVRR